MDEAESTWSVPLRGDDTQICASYDTMYAATLVEMEIFFKTVHDNGEK